MSVISFLVSSGLTQNEACGIGPYYYVYTNVVDEPTQCGGCYGAGLTCWACLNVQTNPNANQLFLDAGLTIPINTGLYYLVNEMSVGNYAYWTVQNSYPQGGPGFFGGCPIGPTPTPTATSNPTTPTNTPTVTQTPSPTATIPTTPTQTPTNTNTPSVTPTNTPTISVTPSVSVSSLPSSGINFRKIITDYQKLADSHKQLNSFGSGNSDQLSYRTQTRDKEYNTTHNSPYYPLLYVIPSKVENDLEYKTWDFNTIVADVLERDLANQVDISSDTLQILQDVISQFRLSVNARFGNYYNDYFVDDMVSCVPFLEKEDDMLNGWNGLIRIKTMTPLNRCAAAFNTFTGTPIQHLNGINLKTFYEDFKLLADHHKQLNSFGFGSVDDFQYLTQSRDKEDNTQFQSPYYPLLYVVPNDVNQMFNYMEYTFDIIVADIIERTLLNQTDVLSDTNQILDDIISQFRLSVTQSLGNFNAEYYLDNPIVCTPFMEQYDDLLGGWTATLKIQVMTPLNRCDAAFFDSFITPTPTVTPTNTSTPTNTPSVTPTNTETPTNTPTSSETPTPTVTATPTIPPTNTPTVTKTPTQTSTSTPTQTPSETPTQTPTPTNTETPTNTPTLTQTPTTTLTATQTNTPTQTETPTNTPTPTNTETPTNTPTPSITSSQTPTQTPSETPTNTPTITQTPTTTTTLTATQTQTPTQTGTGTPTPTPTNTTTLTATPTQTGTPTNTPTPSVTQTMTPTSTLQVTPTNTPTPSSTPAVNECIWNQNNVNWNVEDLLWDVCPRPTPTATTTTTPTPSTTPPPFSPSGVTGLQFWFLSNSGSSVSSWTNYGLLGGSVVQSTAAYQPQVLTGQTLGTYTGTTMRFANRDFMTGSTTSTSFSAETNFIILKRVFSTTQGWAITVYNSLNPTSFTGNYVWYYQSRQFPQNASNVNAKPTQVFMPLSTNCLISSSGDSSTLSATTNGSYTGSSVSTLTGSTDVVRLDIGYDPGFDQGQIHDVFEFISYNRILTSTEYNNVMTYLKTKYNYSSW